jgi:hypothetical protein
MFSDICHPDFMHLESTAAEVFNEAEVDVSASVNISDTLGDFGTAIEKGIIGSD